MEFTQRELKEEKLRRKARDDFWLFCLLVNPDLFGNREKPAKEIAKAFERCYYSDNESYALSVATFPRACKSSITNHFIVWVIGRDYRDEVIRASATQYLSSSLNIKAKRLLEDTTVRKIFPILNELEIIKDTENVLAFKEHYRETLYATSVGGTISGLGSKFIILDDIYKDHTEAMSPTINQKTIDWFQSAVISRTDGKQNKVIFIGTRWRVGELVDILERDDYFDEVIKIPALDSNNKSINESIISTEELLKKKKFMTLPVFLSEYQQEPQLTFNGVFSASDFKYITEEEYNSPTLPKYNRVAFIDPKSKGKDHFAMCILTTTNKYLVLEDVIYTKEILSTNLIHKTAQMLNFYNVDTCFVEVNKEYTLALNLKDLVVNTRIKTKDTTTNKELKIINNAQYVKQVCFLHTNNKEYNNFINELYEYDTSITDQPDDATDCITMGVIEIYQRRKRFNAELCLKKI